jgi:hypothetical protein
MPKHVDHIIDGTELIALKRWGNTRQDVLVSLDDVNASGVISNWANDNLTLTGSRTHETNGNYLQVTTDGLGGFTKSWHITDPTYWNVGFGSTESIYLDSASMNLTSGGWSILRRSGSEIILNENAQNYDTRIEGQTDANLFFVDASTDRVGIGTNTPSTSKVEIVDGSASQIRIADAGGNGWEFRGGTNFIIRDDGTEKFRISQNGNVVLGRQLALATTATDGFTYIPTCAGTPTGTPTAYTGKVPMVYDTTNSIICI